MNINNLDLVEDLISKGEIERAIEKMISFYRTAFKELREIDNLNSHYNNLIICSAQYYKYKGDIISSLIKDQDYIQFNKITRALLNILSHTKEIAREILDEETEFFQTDQNVTENRDLIELNIKSTIESFTLKEQERIISKLSKMLKLDENSISIKYVKSGSVKIGIRIPNSVTSLLFELFNNGDLSKLNIVEINKPADVEDRIVILSINKRIYYEITKQNKKIEVYWLTTVTILSVFPILICFICYYMYSLDSFSLDMPIYANYPFILVSILLTLNILIEYYFLRKYREANMELNELNKMLAITDLLKDKEIHDSKFYENIFSKVDNPIFRSIFFEFPTSNWKSTSNWKKVEVELKYLVKKIFNRR